MSKKGDLLYSWTNDPEIQKKIRERLLAEIAGKKRNPMPALTVLAELEMHNPLWRPRALERLKQATAMAPKHTSAWLALANYWSLRLQPDKQRRCLERILSYEPLNREARQTLDLLATTTS